MARLTRLGLLLAALACALLAGACGSEEEEVSAPVADTEGIYLDVDELKYQVQISRYMNPSDTEDRSYFVGLPEGTAQPAGDETWFGVFIRVQNQTDRPIAPANDFQIVDTQENVYRPIPLDTDANPFAYRADPVGPKSLIPEPDSVAAEGTVQGSLLLFKVKTDSLQNRPLEFRFRRGSGQVGVVDLDI
jgi:hypothetical protein